MECWHQMKCSSFMRSSCIGWSAWPKSRCFLKTYYVKLLIWLDQRCFFCSCSYIFGGSFLVAIYQVVTVLCLQNEGYITLRDVKSSKLSGNVFNILFNLNKFISFETRDPFLIRQVQACFISYVNSLSLKALSKFWLQRGHSFVGTWGSKLDRMGSFCT